MGHQQPAAGFPQHTGVSQGLHGAWQKVSGAASNGLATGTETGRALKEWGVWLQVVGAAATYEPASPLPAFSRRRPNCVFWPSSSTLRNSTPLMSSSLSSCCQAATAVLVRRHISLAQSPCGMYPLPPCRCHIILTPRPLAPSPPRPLALTKPACELLQTCRRCSTILTQLQHQAGLAESGQLTGAEVHPDLCCFAGKTGPSYGSMSALTRQVSLLQPVTLVLYEAPNISRLS
jgi:hypothetical protein